jgi:PPOX class probable F420-dependent enzyme
MSTPLTQAARTLINRPVIANVATVDQESNPQLTPVWIDIDGDDLVFDTAKGRAKQSNLDRNPSVAVSVVDPDDPYNVVIVRGTVEATEDGADAHIDGLAKKYGSRHLPDAATRRGQGRRIYRVRADHVVMQPADTK